MIVIDNGDAIRGIAEVASQLDFIVNGYVGTTATQLADGQMASSETDLYASGANATVVTSITIVNTDSSARTFTLYLKPSAGTSRAISPVSLDLGVGHSFYTDGQRMVVLDKTGGVVTTSIALSDASPNTIEPDDSASAGTGTAASRADHEHAIVGGAPSALLEVQAQAEGSSTSFARADHDHAIVHDITDNSLVTVDGPTAGAPASGEYAKWTAKGLEGKSKAEQLSDLNVADGADVTGSNAPQAHAASHQNAGGDEISVAALSGLLADDQHVLDAEVTAVATAHSLATAVSDFLVASGAGVFVKQTLAQVKTLLAIASDIATHAALSVAGTHGSTTAATADKLVHRDAAGRGKVVAPSVAGDIALKSTVTADITTHNNVANAHGAVSTATASKIVVRDAQGQAAFAAPAGAGDALIKGTRHLIAEMPTLTTDKIWKGVGGVPTEVDVPAGGGAPDAHKDSHDPNDGSDALDTAAPGTNITPEQANAVGVSHSLSRSDHMHYIPSGAPGSIGAGANAEGTGAAFARTDHNHQHTAALHQNGGTAEIGVTGLSGLLADDQHVLDTEVDARVSDALITTTDVTTNNSSTSKHGFLKKLDNSATNFMNGQGNWTAVAGGTPTKEFWVPVTSISTGLAANNSDNFPTRNVDDGEEAFMSFFTPHDFSSITEAVIVGWAHGANQPYDLDIVSAYCAAGEDHATHAESDLVSTYAALNHVIYEVDVSGILSALAAGDYCGISLEQNHADWFKVLGFRMKYA